MSIRPWRDVHRRQSRKIRVGDVEVGGDAPISVQTMTNTLTTDVKATVEQVQACAEAGADIVRVSCPDEASTAAFKEICRESPVPLVADIHFHYKRAIEAAVALRSPASLTMIASLNEWSEGHVLEPEAGLGTAWLEAVREARARVTARASTRWSAT